MTNEGVQAPSRILWRLTLDPVLILSALVALAYGLLGPGLYAQDAPPLFWLAVFKATPVFLLTFVAVIHRSRLLAYALLFGCVGDSFLVWPDKFMEGALAFLVGHVFYITLFLRGGIGIGAALKQWPRLLGAIALIAAAIVMTALLVPRDNAMFIPLSIYTGVLTLMALTSFTLPATRWLAMAGALLFFISDGFVAWNMFHHDPDPTLAYWRSFAGWMIYWAGQAALCYGALGLHRVSR
jgi:uncharacterized membrane protein YhhN